MTLTLANVSEVRLRKTLLYVRSLTLQPGVSTKKGLNNCFIRPMITPWVVLTSISILSPVLPVQVIDGKRPDYISGTIAYKTCKPFISTGTCYNCTETGEAAEGTASTYPLELTLRASWGNNAITPVRA